MASNSEYILMEGENSSESNKPKSSDRSCAHCTTVERVEDATSFAEGQHISMPGRSSRIYNCRKRKLKHCYRHHAIVVGVVKSSKVTAELELIDFGPLKDKNDTIQKTTELIDLSKQEVYHVKYLHPRFKPGDIVKRAKRKLPEEKNATIQPEVTSYQTSTMQPEVTSYQTATMQPEETSYQTSTIQPEDEHSNFKWYNCLNKNCEHFATWCVVGEGESIQVQNCCKMFAGGCNKVQSVAFLVSKLILRVVFNSADEIASASSFKWITEIVLAVSVVLYFIFCVFMPKLPCLKQRKTHMCSSCHNRTLHDMWWTFAMFCVTSVSTYMLINYALPHLGLNVCMTVLLVCLLVLLSVALQWCVPMIRRSLQSPFNVDRKKKTDLSSVNVGDIISFSYYKLEHVAIVTDVNHSDKCVSYVHYSSRSLCGKRKVIEETFPLKTFNLFDCSLLQCNPDHKAVELARKRVGETKWSLFGRSDHLCYWAKVKVTVGAPCKTNTDNSVHNSVDKSVAIPVDISVDKSVAKPVDNSVNKSSDKSDDESVAKTTAFIRYEEVHLVTDLQPGDVVKYRGVGILISITRLDNQSDRRFEIETMVRSTLGCILKIECKIDLNKDKLTKQIYHPALCYPMWTRVEQALAMENKRGKWCTDTGFIEHCILRQKRNCAGFCCLRLV